MKRSEVVIMFPFGVLSEIWPEPVDEGAFRVMEVALAELGCRPCVTFTPRRSFAGATSKFAPVIVTGLPAATICGLKESIRGLPSELVTVNKSALVTELLGDVTLIVPVVAPGGTVTTNVVLDAEATVAVVPLNLTVSWSGSELKLEPEIVTDVPTAPVLG